MLQEYPANVLPRRPTLRPGQLRPRPFQVTDRDVEVMTAIYRYRGLDRPQVERLFFTTERLVNTRRAGQRLQLLYQHGYLKRVVRLLWPGVGNRGPVYRLAPKGAKLVAQHLDLPLEQLHYWGKGDDSDRHQTQVGYPYLEHLLAVAEVHIAFDRAVTGKPCRIEVWHDDADLRRLKIQDHVWTKNAVGKGLRLPITPDAYFLLATATSRGHLFLELDRGTESIRHKWQRKFLAYKEYFAGGTFHQRYGVAERQTAFRVLVITPSLVRAENIRTAAAQYGPSELAQLFLFAPLEAVAVSDVLTDPIWLRGGLTGRQALL